MIKQVSLASDLASILGREHVAPGTPEYAVDGISPKTIVRPGTYEEVAAVMRYANEASLAVIPLGGRTHTALGNLPARYDVALDLTRLDKVVEFEPADLTITCQAGITLGALRQATSAEHMLVPFDPALPDGATVGGALAASLTGPSRMSLGSPRDFTIGLRVVTADGKLTRAGGRVVKNVAGYDLCKLYIGSLGTLGVIVEATFKTRPLPQSERLLAFDFPHPAAACGLVTRAVGAGLAIQSATLIRNHAAWRLSLALAGMSAAVDRSTDSLQYAGISIREAAIRLSENTRTAKQTPLLARITLLPSRLPELLASAPANTIVEAHPATGACLLSFPEATTEAVTATRALATRFTATCVIERCPPDLKRDLDVFGESPPSLPLIRAVKAEFDPNGVLSPGRFVGKL